MLTRTQEITGTGPLALESAEEIFRMEGQMRSISRHSLVYSTGDTNKQAYYIASGEVKLSRYTAAGREFTMDHLGPGSVFGEVEILLGKNRESQAVARSDLIVYALDQDALLELVESRPHFGLFLARQISERQNRLETRLETLLFKSASGKVAQVLLQLAQDYGRESRDGILIDYQITHQEIGNLIATTRETVSYAFMEFREMGLISTMSRRTIIQDKERLWEMARV